VRAVGTAGIAWGTVILAAGSPIWRRLAGAAPTEVDTLALGFLGARHVATGAIQVLLPGHFQRLEIAVDANHAATMLGLAALDPPRRRPALVTAAAAVAGATALGTIRARASGGAHGS
jgi:hypothetical protein